MGNQLLDIPLSEIFVDEHFNCRGTIMDYQISELAENIKNNGLIQPVTVMPYTLEAPYKYKLIAGFRRTKAHMYLQVDTIQCVVNDDIQSDFQARLFNLAENLCRQELNMLEEAKALEALHSMGMSLTEIADALKKSFGWVQERVYLLELPEILQNEANAGWLTGSLVRQFYTLYRKGGETKVIEAAKAAKVRLERGEKVRITSKKHSVLRKRLPSKHDHERIQTLMYDVFGAGFETRLLGYVRGKLSEFELYCYMEIEAKKRNIDWVRPEITDDGYIVTEEADILVDTDKQDVEE